MRHWINGQGVSVEVVPRRSVRSAQPLEKMVKTPGEVLPGVFIYSTHDVISQDSKEVKEKNLPAIYFFWP